MTRAQLVNLAHLGMEAGRAQAERDEMDRRSAELFRIPVYERDLQAAIRDYQGAERLMLAEVERLWQEIMGMQG